MKLLKIIAVIFLIYFIRRFIQMYRVMKRIQEEQTKRAQNQSQQPNFTQGPEKKPNDSIEADYRVVD